MLSVGCLGSDRSTANETCGQILAHRSEPGSAPPTAWTRSAFVSPSNPGAFDARDEETVQATFATIDAEDYTVARVYGAWRVSERLTVKARVENLLDEEYEEVHGYPQLGVGVFVGAEWRF